MHYISSIPAKSAEITHTLKKVSPKKNSPKKEIVLTLRSAKMLVTRFGEMYHCIISGSCSEWVPSEWESKQLIKTSQ